MGDSCWFQISFARKDLDRFKEVLKDEAEDDDGRFWDEEWYKPGDDKMTVVIDDANYGWSDQLEMLAKAHLTFHGEHAAGGTYGPMAFVCFKGEFVDVNTDHDGTPTVAVPKRGIVSGDELARVNRYYVLLEKIKKE